MRKFILLILSVFVSCFIFTGCETKEQEARSGAKQVQFFFKVPLNSQGHTVEQQNVLDRIRVTTDITKVLWIHLIALDGKIIKRMPVRNKVTSSGKRLEPQHAAETIEGYPDFGEFSTDEFIQADGTFGESDSYIFWFDTMGRYHQWGTAGGLGYLLTDYPIDLANPIDEVTGLYNMHKVAYEWQKQQEEILKKK